MTVTLLGSPAIGDFDGIDLDMLIRQGFRPVPVDRIRTLASEVLGIDLIPGEVAPASVPGSHVEVAVPLPDGPAIRHYSLLAGAANRLRVAVLRERHGRGASAWLHENLDSCTSLLIRGPRDTFGYGGTGPAYFVAGGIGITPLTAMISAAASSGRDWHLLYVGRQQESMAFADDLVTEFDSSRVTVHITEAAGRPDVVSAVEDWASSRNEPTTVFTCGPVPLMRALEVGFEQHPSISVISEAFDEDNEAGASTQVGSGLSSAASSVSRSDSATNGATGTESVGIDEAFIVELGDGSEVEVPSECTIIDALNRAGVHTLSSCQKGTCGTCETAILDGRADHRDSVLSDEEHAAQETMMICVSRACGKRIALDL
ncbi:Ferredoxin-NADP reductase [Brevibacterium sp. 239c]|uniref:PDR/VanB family oxidoreductase n=1 Tax=Brevibacterium sp. 239c TaxID=1965356 RepID=UPI000C6B5712|nr:PDR/VanB family oxidoreductase [Brevibacterium sp. 239c]SMX72385.1 Ferredoxin-NADP reductase [Brevibacterium sp. 239c]